MNTMTKAPTVAEAKPEADFTGLTRDNCADACNADHCVISGENCCAHPAKGALQPKFQMQPAVLKRHAAAKALVFAQRATAQAEQIGRAP